MKSDNQQHSFKDGLNSIQDHSASMEEGWSMLERRLEKQEGHNRMVLWARALSAVAAVLLLLLTWLLFQPEEGKQPLDQMTKKQPQQEVQQPDKKPMPAQRQEIAPQPKAPQYQQNSFRDQAPKELPLTNKIKPGANSLVFNKLEPLNFGGNIDLTSYLNRPSAHFLQPARVQVQQPSMEVKTAVEAKTAKARLSLSVIYAPALNGIHNFSGARLGSDVGLLVTLGIAKKWSLTTGAIYAKKLYESDFNSYNPKNKALIPYIPESIYADCRVLDIPVNLNYTLIQKGKNTLSVGTGVSSYLMLKEDYQYRYGQQAGLKDYTYSVKNRNKHLLSILNIEAKYEHRINNKFGIGLQPYLKVPLTNIGYGNVKLQSLGMAINLNLRIGGKSTDKN